MVPQDEFVNIALSRFFLCTDQPDVEALGRMRRRLRGAFRKNAHILRESEADLWFFLSDC